MDLSALSLRPSEASWWLKNIKPFRRIWLSMAALLVIILLGSFGYMVIEGWRFAESFYMTLITLSTVGFQEVRPLSDSGRMFTALLIVVGIGTVGYGFGNLAAFLIEGELKELFETRRMEKVIDSLKEHIIICGYGDEGSHAGEELARSKVPFLIIEKDVELAEKLAAQELLVVPGDATEDEVLLKAGVERARGLIATVPEDADNVFITLTARGFNPDLTIVARAAEKSTAAKLVRAGANKVISSSQIGGRRMASVLLRPKLVNFLDVIMHDEQLSLRLEEVDVEEESPFVGKSIRDLGIRERTGAMVIAYHRQNRPIQVNPAAETVLQPGDVLIVMGTDKQVEELARIAQKH